jgi:hypothetical protein
MRGHQASDAGLLAPKWAVRSGQVRVAISAGVRGQSRWSQSMATLMSAPAVNAEGTSCGTSADGVVSRGGATGGPADGDVDGRSGAAPDVVDDAGTALWPQQAAIEAGVLGEVGEESPQ